MSPVCASKITWIGAAVLGSVEVHNPPAVSNTVLHPTRKSCFGPLLRPAGEQNEIGKVWSIMWVVGSIRTTPPLAGFGPICGIDSKKRWAPGSHAGCSAPLAASTPPATLKRILSGAATPGGGAVGGVSAQVDVLTLMNVPKGGVSALLIARITASIGSYANSSARLRSPDAVETALTSVGGKLDV